MIHQLLTKPIKILLQSGQLNNDTYLWLPKTLNPIYTNLVGVHQQLEYKTKQDICN